MDTYTLNYDLDSKVGGVQKGNMSIPRVEDNMDWVAFLDWNAEQAVPLDLNSTIPIVVPPVKTQEVFGLPVVAPDFIVQSPKPKSDSKEAHAEAIKESKKASKSIASITLNSMVYLENLEKLT